MGPDSQDLESQDRQIAVKADAHGLLVVLEYDSFGFGGKGLSRFTRGYVLLPDALDAEVETLWISVELSCPQDHLAVMVLAVLHYTKVGLDRAFFCPFITFTNPFTVALTRVL